MDPRELVAIARAVPEIVDDLGDQRRGRGGWAGGPDRSSRVAVSFAAALGNPALAIMLVAYAQPDQRAFPLIATYILLRTIIKIPVQWWIRRGQPLAPQPATA